jgi:hypothetical protein
VDIVSGTVHATPSRETSELVIALATSRVFARSAPGCVHPAAGWPVPAGAVPVTAVPGLLEHAVVPGLVPLRGLVPLPGLGPLPEQPAAITPVTTASAAAASADRRGRVAEASAFMAHPWRHGGNRGTPAGQDDAEDEIRCASGDAHTGGVTG